MNEVTLQPTIQRRMRDVLLNALDVYREECGVTNGLGETRAWVMGLSVEAEPTPVAIQATPRQGE